MSYYDGYDDYGTRMEPNRSTWTATGTLIIDGVPCPGEASMTYESESQSVTGTVSKWVDWTSKCRNGHGVSTRAVKDGDDFWSSTVLKQEAPCDGSCPDPISWDDEGNVDYVHKLPRYVCAACLADGVTVEVNPGRRSQSYHREYPTSRVTVMRATVSDVPRYGVKVPFVFVLDTALQGMPEGHASWMQGKATPSGDPVWFRRGGLTEVSWVSHDELRVLSRAVDKGGAPTVPLILDGVKV
jgi:hypothetical protein